MNSFEPRTIFENKRGVVMNSKFIELRDHLGNILNLYKELIELSREKQGELVKGNVESLDKLNKKEENLVFQASRMEAERYRCAREMAEVYNLSEDAKLSELIEEAPPKEKEELTILLNELLLVVEEIDKLNQENIALIQQSLKYVNFTIDVLSQNPPSGTYGSTEKDNKAGNVSRLVDRRV